MQRNYFPSDESVSQADFYDRVVDAVKEGKIPYFEEAPARWSFVFKERRSLCSYNGQVRIHFFSEIWAPEHPPVQMNGRRDCIKKSIEYLEKITGIELQEVERVVRWKEK